MSFTLSDITVVLSFAKALALSKSKGLLAIKASCLALFRLALILVKSVSVGIVRFIFLEGMPLALALLKSSLEGILGIKLFIKNNIN
jgi:hypothetical protein